MSDAAKLDSPESPARYLIAHKVRGEPAFDVAIQIPCPCDNEPTCSECDGFGAWWIIPTSGHRAHPWWNIALRNLQMGYSLDGKPQPSPESVSWDNIDWHSYPDHYTVTASPTAPRPAFLQSLLAKPRVAIPRRGL